MKMDKSMVHLLVLFLGFSYVISSVVAVPTTRSLKPIKENPALTNLEAQEVREGEILVVEGLVERRMVLSTNDYPGTGANNNHDPTTPGSGD